MTIKLLCSSKIIGFSRPMVSKMRHIGMGSLCYCFYILFSNPILVICLNTTEQISLIQQSTILYEGVQSKDTIVSMVCLNRNSFLSSNRFKATFAGDGLNSIS
jgi:hypothetical protein